MWEWMSVWGAGRPLCTCIQVVCIYYLLPNNLVKVEIFLNLEIVQGSIRENQGFCFHGTLLKTQCGQ